MFISERIIYLALHKTGCSHVLKLLSQIKDLNGREIGKHNNVYEVPASVLGSFETKMKCGNIRNPWDWYVSLWAFGCMMKGGLYDHVARKSILRKLKKPTLFFATDANWKGVYANAENPQLFRDWLRMLLVNRRGDVPDLGAKHVPASMGLLTYRYFNLYAFDFKANVKNLDQDTALKQFDTEKNFIDHFILNEHLERDFRSLMKKIEITDEVVESVMSVPKTNMSKRQDYLHYYDEETKLLIQQQEQFIINKHGYQFEKVNL